MTTTRPLWYWCVLGAVAMSLGWGLRGSIGGGSLGAMIPGAMIGLVICLLLDRHSDSGFIAAFAAIGVGFGGQETYGQTVGLSLLPETFWWAILGFVIKGAAWGLLGGAFIGIALDRQRYATWQLLAGFAIMILGTWLGWQYLNNPKLIYFSNRLDRPREELWAGLWLGGLLLLAWLRSRVPSLFALYGAIGGGIGFGVGASLQPLGKAVWAGMPLGWWKAMELTFGGLLGLAYVLCAWRLRHQLDGARSTPAAGSPLPRAFLAAAIAIGLAIVSGQYLPVRFDYTIAGTVLASLVLFSETLAWQTAITATCAAFAWDFLDYQTFAPLPLAWTFVVASTAVVAVIIARYPRTQAMLLLVTWLAVASAFRYLLPPSAVGHEAVTMLAVFVVLALVMSLMLLRRRHPAILCAVLVALVSPTAQPAAQSSVKVTQITHGPQHHYFGYIGQSRTIPWNASGRYLLALQVGFQDRLPGANDPADVCLIDAHDNYAIRVVDRSRGWNPQQGTMFYWNPQHPETQFFFNDRDPKTGKVFTVLFDIAANGGKGARVREYRFEDTPVGNGGVAQNGGYFTAINYARMARLRPVTGYAEAWDWTRETGAPSDDGIFRVDIDTGQKRLIVSFAQLKEALRGTAVENLDARHFFINHTLNNRNNDLIYFFCRADFEQQVNGPRVNAVFTVRPDGSGLTRHETFIGGHPDWGWGSHVIGSNGGQQVVYDAAQQKIVDSLGGKDVFPNPEGDVSLSPDGSWFVNSHREGEHHHYTFLEMKTRRVVKSPPVFLSTWNSGPLRLDPAPAWNRTSDAIVVPGIASDGTRQMFLLELSR